MADIKLQAAEFSSVVFHHVYRSINGAAHISARTCYVASSRFILDHTGGFSSFWQNIVQFRDYVYAYTLIYMNTRMHLLHL